MKYHVRSFVAARKDVMGFMRPIVSFVGCLEVSVACKKGVEFCCI